MVKKIFALLLLNIILTLPLHAQDGNLEELLLKGNKLYAVIAVLLVILFGIFFFLISMDRKIKKLED